MLLSYLKYQQLIYVVFWHHSLKARTSLYNPHFGHLKIQSEWGMMQCAGEIIAMLWLQKRLNHALILAK